MGTSPKLIDRTNAIAQEADAPHRYWPHDLVLGLLLLLFGFELLLSTAYLPLRLRGVADFRQFYTAGYMVRTGHSKQLYDYKAQQRFQDHLVPVDFDFPLLISHPAFEELLFVPLSLLSFRVAYFIFMAFNCSLLVVSAWLLTSAIHPLPGRWKWLPALLIPSFHPVSRALLHGQDSIMLLALLAAALWYLGRGKELSAGLLVGIGVFRFPIVIPIALLFLAWRKWRFSVGFAGSSLVAALISLAMVGIDGVRQYINLLASMSIRLASAEDMHRYTTDPREMLNLRGLVCATVGGHFSAGTVQLIILAASVAILLLAAKQQPSLPLAITAASLVSYHFLLHDATVLVIPVAAALTAGVGWQGAIAALVLLAPILAVNPPYGYLSTIPIIVFFWVSLRKPSFYPKNCLINTSQKVLVVLKQAWLLKKEPT